MREASQEENLTFSASMSKKCVSHQTVFSFKVRILQLKILVWCEMNEGKVWIHNVKPIDHEHHVVGSGQSEFFIALADRLKDRLY